MICSLSFANDNKVQNLEVQATEPQTTTEQPFWKSSSFYDDFRLQQEKTLQTSKEAADRTQENISIRLHRFSGSIDKFFAEENYVQESQDSRLRVSLSNRYQRFYDPSLKPRLNLSLALPNTKDRWRLRFQSNDEEVEDEENENQIANENDLTESIADTTFTTALGLVLSANEMVNIQLDAGIKFRTPIDPFTKFRVRRTFNLDSSEIRLTETLEWRDSQGKTAQTAFEFETPVLQSHFIFRTTSRLTYWDINTYIGAYQSLTLYQPLTEKSALAYSIGFSGQNEDEFFEKKKDQVNHYWVELRYKKNFYKNWLYYQITPGLSHERAFDFEISPRIEFRLEAIYGYGESQTAP